jgi:RNA polymerase sigma factor (sigma-70 family)
MDNREHLEHYYTLHRAGLLAYASARLGDRDEAEDLVQDTFLRLLVTDKMITPQTLPALTFTILRNLVNDHYRRRAFRFEYEHYLCSGGAAVFSMESSIFASDIVRHMEHCLLRIPESCRNVYRMHVLDGMKVSDISLVTGEKYKTIENRLGQARRTMRGYLKAVV